MKTWQLILVIVFAFAAMSMGKGMSGNSGLGKLWVDEMANSNAIMDQVRADCAAGKVSSCGWGGFGQ